MRRVCRHYDENHQTQRSATSRWLSYRPEIKVVDCTIRDGGLMNNHHFDGPDRQAGL